MPKYVGAIDQGTTSTRFMVFDHAGAVVAIEQREHRQIYPRPGWVEHDPLEILTRCREVVRSGLAKAGLAAGDLATIGIANQRETTVVWDRLDPRQRGRCPGEGGGGRPSLRHDRHLANLEPDRRPRRFGRRRRARTFGAAGQVPD